MEDVQGRERCSLYNTVGKGGRGVKLRPGERETAGDDVRRCGDSGNGAEGAGRGAAPVQNVILYPFSLANELETLPDFVAPQKGLRKRAAVEAISFVG